MPLSYAVQKQILLTGVNIQVIIIVGLLHNLFLNAGS